MKKVIPKKIDKIWGYEIWLYSPVKNMETKFEDGTKTIRGPLIKIIQANKPLSVQVHPDDKFAKELEGEKNGKSESWYVLDHKENASLVLGLKQYDNCLIKKQLEENSFEENLFKKEIKKGDFYNIPAGLVHGIGANIKVLEVQQPSDITYRYYDYGRLENGKPRELHIAKAIKVQKELDFRIEPKSYEPLIYVNKVGSQQYMDKPTKLEEDSIVVDITNEEAYTFKQGEQVIFKKYCIISY